MFVFQGKAQLKMEVKREVASIPEDNSQNKVATFVCKEIRRIVNVK